MASAKKKTSESILDAVPEVVEIKLADVDSVDAKGRLLWKEHRLVLTDELISKLRDLLEIKPQKRDYKQMKLSAVMDLLDCLMKYPGSQVLTCNPDKAGNKRRNFMLNEARLVHPDDWVKFLTRMDQIDAMEKEDT